MINKKIIAVFIIITIGALATVIALIQRNNSNQRLITNLHIQIDDLEAEAKKSEAEISELEEKISALEENLAEVEHFDTDGSLEHNLSARTSGGISYTGEVMETKIDGEFEGWDGETIFKMMNGTIWQQASYDYTYHYAYMPDVIVFRKRGTFYMRVEGVDDEIAVNQIK